MKRMVRAIALVIGAVLVSQALGCAPAEQEDAGESLAELTGTVPVEREHYLQAGERYTELNERFAALQREIHADEWREGATRSEVVPGPGFEIGTRVARGDRNGSYYFTVSRWHEAKGSPAAELRRIARLWRARGWDVVEEIFSDGTGRIFAFTADEFRFEAAERGTEVILNGRTSVYAGEHLELSLAIAARRDAENAAGAPWDTTDRDEQGHAYRLPGEYRPFPSWNGRAR